MRIRGSLNSQPMMAWCHANALTATCGRGSFIPLNTSWRIKAPATLISRSEKRGGPPPGFQEKEGLSAVGILVSKHSRFALPAASAKTERFRSSYPPAIRSAMSYECSKRNCLERLPSPSVLYSAASESLLGAKGMGAGQQYKNQRALRIDSLKS